MDASGPRMEAESEQINELSSARMLGDLKSPSSGALRLAVPLLRTGETAADRAIKQATYGQSAAVRWYGWCTNRAAMLMENHR